jgi:hypothetical protein
MCRVSGSVIAINPYAGINTQSKIDNTKVVSKTDIPKVNHTEKKDSVKVNSKSSKNDVIHSVNIEKPVEKTLGEKISKTISGVIGNTQDGLDITKKISSLGTASGAVSKVSHVAKAITSLTVIKSIDKIASKPIVNKALGVFSVVGGGFEIARGVKEIKKGKTEQGVFSVLNGGAGVVMGGALLVGAAPVAVVAGFVGLGVSVVKYGSQSVKDLGWLKGKDGKAQTAFEHLAEKANDAQKSVEKATGSKVLGYVAKVGSGVVMVPAAVATSVAGAVVSGGKAIGNAVSKAWDYLF